MLLQAAAELSIIRGSKTEWEHALAKSQWSFKTAAECSAALAAKKVSAVELAQDAIGRIERHDGKINAVCVRDFTRGLDAARAAGKFIDGWHQAVEWTLLAVIGLHVAAALVHLLVYRNRIMHRMLPG